MNFQPPLKRLWLVSAFFTAIFSAPVQASSIKAGFSKGNNDYRGGMVEGRIDTVEKSQLLLSLESSGSPDQISSGGKIGYSTPLNETTDFDGDLLFDKQPGNVRDFGINPTFTFNSIKIIRGKDTSLSVGGKLLLYTYTQPRNANAPQLGTITEKFASTALTLAAAQPVAEHFTLNLSAAYYHYSKKPVAIESTLTPAGRRGRPGTYIVGFNTLNPDASYPLHEYSLGLDWEFAEEWRASGVFSASNVLFNDKFSYGEGLNLFHRFSKLFDGEVDYNTGNNGQYYGGFYLTYHFGAKDEPVETAPVPL